MPSCSIHSLFEPSFIIHIITPHRHHRTIAIKHAQTHARRTHQQPYGIKSIIQSGRRASRLNPKLELLAIGYVYMPFAFNFVVFVFFFIFRCFYITKSKANEKRKFRLRREEFLCNWTICKEKEPLKTGLDGPPHQNAIPT